MKNKSNYISLILLLYSFALLIGWFGFSPLDSAYGNTRTEVEVGKAYADEIVKETSAACTGMSTDEAAEYINNVLHTNFIRCEHSVNNDDEFMHGTIYNAKTNGEMVCRGFAELSAEMWRALGYDAEMAVGYLIDENNKVRQHAWTVVYYDGQALKLDYSAGTHVYFRNDKHLDQYTEICTYGTNAVHNVQSDIAYKEFTQKKEV